MCPGLQYMKEEHQLGKGILGRRRRGERSALPVKRGCDMPTGKWSSATDRCGASCEEGGRGRRKRRKLLKGDEGIGKRSYSAKSPKWLCSVPSQTKLEVGRDDVAGPVDIHDGILAAARQGCGIDGKDKGSGDPAAAKDGFEGSRESENDQAGRESSGMDSPFGFC